MGGAAPTLRVYHEGRALLPPRHALRRRPRPGRLQRRQRLELVLTSLPKKRLRLEQQRGDRGVQHTVVAETPGNDALRDPDWVLLFE